MNESGKALMATVPACIHWVAFFQSDKQTLNIPPVSVTAQRSPIPGDRSLAVAPMSANPFDGVSSKCSTERIIDVRRRTSGPCELSQAVYSYEPLTG